MRRREVIAALGAGVAWPLAAHAQQHVPRIGLLVANQGLPRSAIIRSLAERGYLDGRTVVIHERNAEGELHRLPELARELVSIPVDIIVSVAASATVAARGATATIPIVMVHAGDPIGYGLIETLARPGGNVTGTTSYSPEITAKAVELLHELVPTIGRLAVLAVPSNAGTPLAVRQAQLAASKLGIGLIVVGVERAEDLNEAFATIKRASSDSLLVFGEPMLFTNRSRLFEFAGRMRLPTIYTIGEFVRHGGLIGYGPVFEAHHQLAADYVDKVLKGANPAELPVAQSSKFELVINMKAAMALGITVPLTLQAQADEVIE